MNTTMTNNTTSEPPSSTQQQQQQPIRQYLTLLLSQQSNPNPSYINSIILKAISDPTVHAGFSEISALPLIQKALQDSSTGKSLLNTIDLFSYGSFLDYSNANDEGGTTYAKLNDAQVMKLKLLTVVTIVQQTLDSMNGAKNEGSGDNAVQSSRMRRNRRHQVGTTTATKETKHKNCGIVQYSVLHKALGTNDDIRQLEDILIKSIYSNLLPSGTKLDQKNMCLVVKHSLNNSASSVESHHVLCRDVNLTHDIPDMISKLQTMYSRGENVKNHLENSLSGLNQGIVDDVEKWRRIEESIKLTKEKVTEKNTASADMLGDMDLDREGGSRGGLGFRRWSGFGSKLKRSKGGRRG